MFNVNLKFIFYCIEILYEHCKLVFNYHFPPVIFASKFLCVSGHFFASKFDTKFVFYWRNLVKLIYSQSNIIIFYSY